MLLGKNSLFYMMLIETGKLLSSNAKMVAGMKTETSH